MSRTYRTPRPIAIDLMTWEYVYSNSRDWCPRSHRGKRARCECQGPRDRWHKKRRRRAMRAGATPREAEIAMGW